MSVLILILKIIGILLLVLLGLLLFLFLAVLFWPVGYRITGRIEDEIDFKAKLHWLCYLISFRFVMENGRRLAILRIFGIPIQIYPVKERKPKKSRRRKKTKKKIKKSKKTRKSKKKAANPAKDAVTSDSRKQESSQNSQNSQDSEDERKPRNSRDSEHLSETGNELTPANVTGQTENGSSETAESNGDTSWTDKISGWFENIKSVVQRIKNILKTLPERLKGMFSRITDIKNWFWDENNKKTSLLIYKEILYLLLHYHPRKIKAEVRFSAGDPAWTGEAMGILSMIPFLYQKKVQIAPDFMSESAYFKGILDTRGRIRMIHLIRSVLHIWKDKNIKTLIKSRRS